jgi:hypothetical protein
MDQEFKGSELISQVRKKLKIHPKKSPTEYISDVGFLANLALALIFYTREFIIEGLILFVYSLFLAKKSGKFFGIQEIAQSRELENLVNACRNIMVKRLEQEGEPLKSDKSTPQDKIALANKLTGLFVNAVHYVPRNSQLSISIFLIIGFLNFIEGITNNYQDLDVVSHLFDIVLNELKENYPPLYVDILKLSKLHGKL